MTLAVLVNPRDFRDSRARPFPQLVVGGLTIKDEKGTRRPQIAEAIPSVDNGLWKLFPDGTMETTWRIREGARWHDGAPFTADDLVFTTQVARDPAVNAFSKADFDLIDDVQAPDPRTVVVHWRQPFIEADGMFSEARIRYTIPVPRHLLERPFLDSKVTFDDLPYWNTDFVSLGPFRLREWSSGSGAVLEGFPDFVLGQPKIDRIEVKFLTDPNTLIANVLAGAVDLTAARAVNIEQGASLRDQWHEGRMGTSTEGWTMMYPQLHHPNPPLVGDPRLRRALVYAIDRQALADTVMAGFAPVAHSIISPDQAEFPFVDGSIVRYEYDPARAAQLVEGMGLARGSDGFFRDGAGERLAPKIQTTVNDDSRKAAFAIADAWQRIGVAGEASILPAQGVEPEVRWAYGGFDLVNQDHGVDGVVGLLHSASAPLPERNYRAANSARNRGSYVNPEYDALHDRYVTTVPIRERMQALAEMVHVQTDLQLVIGLFYTVNAVMMSNRLQNVPPGNAWNAYLWDIE
jgi:peptide/nickel transport system substrate-binding protein